MSADNWAVCPRCAKPNPPLPDLDREQFRTFREDYEFWGAEEGTVVAHYKGRCTKCGLSCAFDYSRPFYDPVAS